MLLLILTALTSVNTFATESDLCTIRPDLCGPHHQAKAVRPHARPRAMAHRPGPAAVAPARRAPASLSVSFESYLFENSRAPALENRKIKREAFQEAEVKAQIVLPALSNDGMKEQ